MNLFIWLNTFFLLHKLYKI